jgi:hypothetical protein
MYRIPCIDITQFCNDLCIGQNVAMIYAINLLGSVARRYMPNLLVLLYHPTKAKLNFIYFNEMSIFESLVERIRKYTSKRTFKLKETKI